MRPITVMPILHRLYSAIRLRQTIFKWQEAVIENCGDRAQGVAGCRQGASTKDLVYAASMMLERAIWEGDTITGVSYDLSKAFDVVNHHKLVEQIGQTDLHPNLKRWLVAYLRDRKVRCLYQGKSSKWRKLKMGVPQGSVISPLLFNFYARSITPSDDFLS